MRILTGYLFIALSAFIILAVLSFSPQDSVWLMSNARAIPHNIGGSWGAASSTFLIILYGQWGSILFSFAMLVIGINILVKAKIGRILVKTGLFFIAIFSLSILIALIWPNSSIYTAGLGGTLISHSLTEILPSWFWIPIFTLMFILSLFSTIKLFRVVTLFFAKAVGAIVLSPFKLFGLIKNNQDVNEENIPDLDQSPSPTGVFQNNRTTYETHKIKNDDTVTIPTVFNSEKKEPDFLKKNDTTGSGLENTFLGEEAEPAFLSSESEKKKIIDEINRRFQNVIFDQNDIITKNDETESSENTSAIIAPDNKKDKETELKTETDYSDTKEISANDTNNYHFPSLSELEKSFDSFTAEEEKEETDRISRIIETTFSNFKIDIRVTGYSRGPAITRYELVPPVGLKLKSIYNLSDDLALNLGTKHIRIVAPIGNQSLVGVEIPNKHRHNIVLRDIVSENKFKYSNATLPLILGMDISGKILIEDLAKMPHLLIAGTTGSGKSVYVNSLISGLLFRLRQDQLKFILIDPKMVELELYNGIPHLLAPVITQPEEALAALEWAVKEMERRYQILSDFAVRNIHDYNKQAESINKQRKKHNEDEMEILPFIVIVIDEFANLMLRSPKETEKNISRLAAMARAVGIHLVIATQRPSVDVVTGIIKANFPSRIAFRVSSRTDSRTILDKNGAESLLGRGDMLFVTPTSNDMLRLQSPFVSNSDVENIVMTLKNNGGPDFQIDFDEESQSSLFGDEEPSLTVDPTGDPIFAEALKTAVTNGEISASYIQRKFRVGYNRASRIMEGMDNMGILAPSKGSSKPREVIIKQEDLVHYL